SSGCALPDLSTRGPVRSTGKSSSPKAPAQARGASSLRQFLPESLFRPPNYNLQASKQSEVIFHPTKETSAIARQISRHRLRSRATNHIAAGVSLIKNVIRHQISTPMLVMLISDLEAPT